MSCLKFWETVLRQFETDDFDVILSVRTAMECNHELGKALIPFLMKQSCITSNLEVLTRFELLSDRVKLNFIYLLCYTRHLVNEIPDLILSDEFHRDLVNCFTEEPRFVAPPPKQIVKNEEVEEVEEFDVDPLSPTFYDDLDNFIVRHPDMAESVLNDHFQTCPFQSFYNSVVGFFSKHHSLEGCQSVCRFVIRPYISSLTSSANRLVSDALMFLAKAIPEMFIEEVVQPIVFDASSKVYQFELLQRLFNEPVMCQTVLFNLFKGRTPSLERPLRKEALNYICTAIQKSSQLDEESLMHVMLHLRTQIEHNRNDAPRLFVFFLKSQDLVSDMLLSQANDIIKMLPPKMQPFAIQSIKKHDK